MNENQTTSKQVSQAMNHGQTLKFTLPSLKYWVEIREQNGADDDILSNEALAKDLTNLDVFISSLVLNTNLPVASNKKTLSASDVKLLALRDKYYIVFMSRIHTIGDVVRIKYDWGQNNGGQVEYIVNLREEFIWNFDMDFPEEGSSNYLKSLIKPYDTDPYELLEFTLVTGKHLRFKPLNGESEKYLMKLNIDQQTKNSEIKARSLQLNMDSDWIKIENFQMFTKKEMIEINSYVSVLDPNMNANTELENPKDGSILNYPVIATVDFFFPEEI